MNHMTITPKVFSPLLKKNPQGPLLLDASGLRKAFGGHVVINDLSVQLCRGEVVLLRGPNGSGKTTLLNILTGNVEPDSGSIHIHINGTTEHFRFPRPWWKQLNPFDHFAPERVAREGIGRTWQDIRLFSTQSLEENVAVAAPHQLGENPFNALFHFLKVNRQEKENLVLSQKALAHLGLGDRTRSSADRISLGQSKRVAIARAIRAGAKVLFLDEPLAGLDVDGVNDIIELIRGIAGAGNLTLVIIEHVLNIPRILDFATTVWTLRGGKIKSESPGTVRNDYNGGSSAVDSIVKEWSTAANPPKTETLTLKGGALLNIVGNKTGQQPLLEVRDLAVYRGKRPVIGEKLNNGKLRGLSFKVYEGQLAVLKAPNGWGKTTLFKAISGLIPAKQGGVFLNGKPISNLPPWERVREGLSFLQAQDNVFPNLTVSESLRLAQRDCIFPDGLPADKKVSALSGGQKQALALNCTAGHHKEMVVLMDEPFSNFDRTNTGILVKWINDTLKYGACVLALPYI